MVVDVRVVVEYVVLLSEDAKASDVEPLLCRGFRVRLSEDGFVARKVLKNPLMVEIREMDSFLEGLKLSGVVKEFNFSVIHSYR